MSDLKLRVRKLFRPEDTHKGVTLSQQLDLNQLYWNDEETVVDFARVAGKCFLVFAENLDAPPQEWSGRGPNRFYFSQTYDARKREFSQVDGLGSTVGRMGKGKGCGKGKSKKATTGVVDAAELWPSVAEPLKIMDVFAGCGGLSEGLHQSGVGETMWAVSEPFVARDVTIIHRSFFSRSSRRSPRRTRSG